MPDSGKTESNNQCRHDAGLLAAGPNLMTLQNGISDIEGALVKARGINTVSNNSDFAAPDRVLLATDIADLDYLVPQATSQCQASAASLTIAHVIPDNNSNGFDTAAGTKPNNSEIRSRERLQLAQARLEEAAAQIRAAGIECQTMIRWGYPYPVIEEIVRQGDIKRLIVGTHGRGYLSKFFLGSTAHEILTAIHVPVLIVGPHARGHVGGVPRRILHPVSLNSGYQEAAQFAIKIAQFHEAEISFLHVLSPQLQPGFTAQRVLQWIHNELKHLARQEVPEWLKATSMVEQGDIVERIVFIAQKSDADLVVMGANPGSAFWPVYGDRTVYNVIAQAKCPVLTLLHSHRQAVNPAKPQCTILI